MKEILEIASSISPQIIKWRRELHAIPELDLDLPMTRAMIEKNLRSMGINFRTFEGHSGITADIIGSECEKAPMVALRADMDALPIEEETGLPYASANGSMHACAHDAHAAMLLGAAKILTENKNLLRGNVRLIFQPAEERSGGAERMADAGALEGVGAVFGQHAGVLVPDLPSGCAAFRSGAIMASRDSFTITVHGHGCHGALPANGVDPVVVAACIITTLQTLVSRECNGDDSVVLTIGSIHGGEAYNIIPDKVVMIGAVRCVERDMRQRFEKRINEVCHGIAGSMRASCTIEYEHGYPVTVNDADMTELAMQCASEILGPEHVRTLEFPLMGSEDMSVFLERCPGCYWMFSTPPADGTVYPHHNPHFTIDESLLYKGTALLTGTALKWIGRQLEKEVR